MSKAAERSNNSRMTHARRHDLVVAGAAGQVNMGQEIRRAIQDSLEAINE